MDQSLQGSPQSHTQSYPFAPGDQLALNISLWQATKDAGVPLIDIGHTLLQVLHSVCRGEEGHSAEKEQGGPTEPGGSQPHQDSTFYFQHISTLTS